ncbi:MAG: DEAD/DEAH box helicase [Candidatus Nomurabacteria bacterium]|nr:DEAD/DEAH box helicase [Candidatus Nomurabacteria bacterium]
MAYKPNSGRTRSSSSVNDSGDSRPSLRSSGSRGGASHGGPSRSSHNSSSPARPSRDGGSRSSAPYAGGGNSRPSSSGGRGNFSGNRRGRTGGSGGGGGSRSGSSRAGGRGKGNFERIDFSRFINKATITEKEEVYIPTHTFSDFKVADSLKRAIANKNYIFPSPIQDKAIPHALEGRDIVGIANTGTGKTAAFLIPLINKILNNKNEKVIILAPTRELAIQIEKELFEFVRGMGIFSVVCVGGAPIFPQIKTLRRRCDFIIGTPGRIMDLVDRKEIILSTVNNIVLDEADRMLDMGFVDDMTKILRAMPEEKQAFLFSATLPKEVEKLVERFTKDPVRVMVKTRDTSKNVEQDIVRIARGTEKMDVLEDLLSSAEFDKVIIFAEMKHTVEKISVELIKRGFRAGSIHGDKRHNERQRTLTQFKDGTLSILVATDVAARGLDIPNVSHVINFEVPQTYDTYVHRIGRTGRASAKGMALTFVAG